MRTPQASLLIAAVAMALAGCNATAPERNDQKAEVKLEKRFITGSRIKQEYDPESERPMIGLNVRVINRKEIDRTGAVSVDAALRKTIPN